MACVLTSDDRVGEVLLSRVVCDQLAEVSSSEGLLMETQTMENEHDERIVTQLALMIRKIGDAVEKDGELNDTIDGIVGKMSNKSNYWKVAEHVFEDGHITWERIAVLFYVAGRIAVKVVIAHLPQYVKDILTWTLEYFKSKLLSWVQDNGGWTHLSQPPNTSTCPPVSHLLCLPAVLSASPHPAYLPTYLPTCPAPTPPAWPRSFHPSHH
uniref:Bcl-2 Bcl-2 homology region 1-3 domain-containing protein n=1 Tax=Esox lucius TaxID=8010 RepID=A0A3P9APD3_ESOLU